MRNSDWIHTRRWSLRYASAAEPKTANGMRFDRRLLRDRSDVLEGELDYKPRGHAGALRVLSFLNHSDAGSYAAAIHLADETGTTPDVTATRRVGTLKYGFEFQACTHNIWRAGGLDFNIGDGGLRYAPETVSESYYSARVRPGLFATFDLQRAINPAFNRDRGPVWIPTVRLHVEFGR
ncbi:MAG TPA: carbohydrate porin [Bryobacteraceae bacterium]|nr:carbohydrate porin [Bryobacteraceae bacterium]